MESENINRVLLFSVDQCNYAMDITYLQSIIDVPNMVKLPGIEGDVEGIMNHRGSVITLLNLLNKKMEAKQEEKVLLLTSKRANLGLLVDQVIEVTSLDREQMHNIKGIQLEQEENHMPWITSAILKEESIYLFVDVCEIIKQYEKSRVFVS